MIRIAITAEAFEAIAATRPPGSIAVEPQVDANGERGIWLERSVVDRLRSRRGLSESYSDGILRLVLVAPESRRSGV